MGGQKQVLMGSTWGKRGLSEGRTSWGPEVLRY